MKEFDLIVLGAGPGGYIAAIRASQLGLKVAIVEGQELGGVCLNRGCIPTKAMLHSAHAVHQLDEMASLGINIEVQSLNGSQAVKRAEKISQRISKGVSFLMNKNKIEVIKGYGSFVSDKIIEVKSSRGHTDSYKAKNFIIATGAHYRTFDNLVHDSKRLIGAWEAVKLKELPKSIGIIGAGAIGVEFAYFWNAFNVDVHIFELQDRLLPIEDKDCSIELAKSYKKYGIKTSLGIKNVKAKNNGDSVTISFEQDGKSRSHEFEMGLIAVGMTGNIENIGLEKIKIQCEKGFIKVNEYYQTNLNHIYAIGDVAGPPLLAHVASHEGVVATEHMKGLNPHPLDKMNLPSCTYCQPQVASVGYTEQALKEKKTKYSVGKLPFIANGKAIASNEKEGFVKVLMGEHGELLGAHIVGTHATELIHEYTLFRTMEGIDEEIFATVHPHPTLGEWLAEACMVAKNRGLNY